MLIKNNNKLGTLDYSYKTKSAKVRLRLFSQNSYFINFFLLKRALVFNILFLLKLGNSVNISDRLGFYYYFS